MEGSWRVESEGKRLQRCGEPKQLLSLVAGWKAREVGMKGLEDQLPEIRMLDCIGKVSPALEGCRKAGFSVFSASDEALPAALSLWYPGVMQSNLNVSRLITGNWASAPSKED